MSEQSLLPHEDQQLQKHAVDEQQQPHERHLPQRQRDAVHLRRRREHSPVGEQRAERLRRRGREAPDPPRERRDGPSRAVVGVRPGEGSLDVEDRCVPWAAGAAVHPLLAD